MSQNIKILVFAGSARKESFNKKLAAQAAKFAEDSGAQINLIDLADFAMPLFNEDLESDKGMPETAKQVKAMMVESDGFIIASPEYNSSVTPLLKNTIDWASRATSKDEAPLQAFQGKTAALLSASPGGFGGLRGLVHVRAILGNIGVFVIPQQVCIPKAHDAFDPQNKLKDSAQAKKVKELVSAFVQTTEKLKR